MLQSQDMGRIGFVQDLLRGMEKILCHKPKAQEADDIEDVKISSQTIDSQHADNLTNNAEAFIKLRRENDAMEIYKKMQVDYPGDWRGWWGAARMRSNEFADTTLEPAILSSIFEDCENAITVSSQEDREKLSAQLEKYIADVYQEKIANLQKKSRYKMNMMKSKLEKSMNDHVEKKRLCDDTKMNYTKVANSNGHIMERLNSRKTISKTITVIIAIVFVIFIVSTASQARNAFQGLGMLIFGTLIFGTIPVFLCFIINFLLVKPVEMKLSLKDEETAKQKYSDAEDELNALSVHIEDLRNDIKKYEHILGSLSKERDTEAKKMYLSSKSPYCL